MIPPGGHRSERQVVIGEVLVVRLWCCVLVRLVVVSLRGIVAPQLAVGAVFDRGGDEVEAFHEVGEVSVVEIVRQYRETQRAARALLR